VKFTVGGSGSTVGVGEGLGLGVGEASADELGDVDGAAFDAVPGAPHKAYERAIATAAPSTPDTVNHAQEGIARRVVAA
jgi:hypothetical protein